MIRYISDMLFMIVVWALLLYNLHTGDISFGLFLIGATLSYVGARVLFIFDFILELLESCVEFVEDDE